MRERWVGPCVCVLGDERVKVKRTLRPLWLRYCVMISVLMIYGPADPVNPPEFAELFRWDSIIPFVNTVQNSLLDNWFLTPSQPRKVISGRCRTVQYTLKCNTMQNNIMQYNTVQYNTLTMQYSVLLPIWGNLFGSIITWQARWLYSFVVWGCGENFKFAVFLDTV